VLSGLIAEEMTVQKLRQTRKLPFFPSLFHESDTCPNGFTQARMAKVERRLPDSCSSPSKPSFQKCKDILVGLVAGLVALSL